MTAKLIFQNILSWTFGMFTMAIGLINIFWGNDPEYGVFIFALSFVYFLPSLAIFKRITGISLPPSVKVLLAFFIVCTAVGVGELFTKIAMMRN